MITEAEYDRVQTLLGRNGNPREQSQHEFAFTGLIRCGECDRMVTAEEKHQVMCGNCKFKFAYRRKDTCPRCETPIEQMVKPLFLHYTYYHCSKSRRPMCQQKCVTGLELERQINEHLARISISQQFKGWAVKYLHELYAQESATQKSVIEVQQKAYQECLERIDSLLNLKTSPGNRDGSLLSDSEYAQRRGKLLKEQVAPRGDKGHTETRTIINCLGDKFEKRNVRRFFASVPNSRNLALKAQILTASPPAPSPPKGGNGFTPSQFQTLAGNYGVSIDRPRTVCITSIGPQFQSSAPILLKTRGGHCAVA